jgi:hypothetical protein
MYPMRIYLLLTATADPVLGGLPHHKATLRYRAPGGDRRRVAFSRGAGKWLLPQLKGIMKRKLQLVAVALGISAPLLASAQSSTQGLTREQVRQEAADSAAQDSILRV